MTSWTHAECLGIPLLGMDRIDRPALPVTSLLSAANDIVTILLSAAIGSSSPKGNHVSLIASCNRLTPGDGMLRQTAWQSRSKRVTNNKHLH